MDLIDELLAEAEAAASGATEVAEAFPECPYCLNREPVSNRENNSTNQVTEFLMIFDYVTWKGVHTTKWAHRLIHKKHGFTIDLHDCVDLGGWAFKLSGSWPQMRPAIAQLDAFIKYARRSHETRIQKPKIQLSDLYAAVRNLPDTAEWPEILDYLIDATGFVVTYDAVMAMLRRRKIKGGLPAVRKRVKQGYE